MRGLKRSDTYSLGSRLGLHSRTIVYEVELTFRVADAAALERQPSPRTAAERRSSLELLLCDERPTP